jgi:hypothetical protein
MYYDKDLVISSYNKQNTMDQENQNQQSNSSQSETANQASKIAEDVKSFYKNEFKDILLKFFLRPIDGLLELFSGDTDAVFKTALILSGSIYLLFVVGIKILTGNIFNLFSCIKIGFAPLITMIVISCVAFGIKSISGKPNLKHELLTGALAGLPMVFMLALAIIGKSLFTPDAMDIGSLFENPASILNKIGIVFGLVSLAFFYALLMLINVFQQSLKAAKTNDTITWYVSPLAVFISIYLAIKIVVSIS